MRTGMVLVYIVETEKQVGINLSQMVSHLCHWHKLRRKPSGFQHGRVLLVATVDRGDKVSKVAESSNVITYACVVRGELFEQKNGWHDAGRSLQRWNVVLQEDFH